jgi:hypothetical protein
MPKTEGWKKGEGPYSKSDDIKLNRQPDKSYVPPKDISKKVDPSWERTEGFSAKLDKAE